MSHLEDTFAGLWSMLAPTAPNPVREYRFAPPRRWRFDFAFPHQRVAVELEGGVFVRGRHQRPGGFQNDVEKYNAATLGWRVLRYTSVDLKLRGSQVVAEVVGLLRGRDG